VEEGVPSKLCGCETAKSSYGLLCLSLPDVFAVLDGVLVIDVGRVVRTSAAVDVVLETIRSADRVIVGTTQQLVETETAIYAVHTESAIYLVGTTATVAIVVACQTRYGVCMVSAAPSP
jgi:hypothetical protein